MKTVKVLLFTVVGFILPENLSAQSVSGKLIDENSHPLPYANVVLLSLPDSAFVSGTVSGDDGTHNRCRFGKPDSEDILHRI